MSFPPKQTGGGIGGNPGFNLNSRNTSVSFDNQYSLPMGGWTTVPYNIIGGVLGFQLDPVTHEVTVVDGGVLTVVARAGVQPNLETNGVLRLTVMILKNGAPIAQVSDSVLSYDTMCSATATAVEYFNEGDIIQVATIGEGAEWKEAFHMVQPSWSLNCLQAAYLLPEVVV